MSRTVNPNSIRRRPPFALLPFFFLFLICPLTFGQGVGSTRELSSSGGGTNSIQGHIYFPIDPSGGKRLRVRLSSTDMANQTTVTDEDGTFRFNGLTAGHYTVTVEGGKDFDPATESVSIDRETSSGGRVVQVVINLKVKGSADALAKIPKAARDLYAKGKESAAKGDSKKAAEQLSEAVSLYPDFAQALNELGVQYLKLGQADKAADSFKAALKLTPDELAPRLNYGIALLQQKKFAEAETQLREVVKKNDQMPTAHMYLGIALMSQQKLDDAEKELLRAISFKSNEVSAAHRYLGGIYWGRREYQRAADELETYLKLMPNAPDAERTKTAIKELRAKK